MYFGFGWFFGFGVSSFGGGCCGGLWVTGFMGLALVGSLSLSGCCNMVCCRVAVFGSMMGCGCWVSDLLVLCEVGLAGLI